MTQRAPKQQPSAISVSVREMVEFVLRTGDLGGRGDFFAPTRMLEGTRGHQKIQKLRPEGYQAEVRLKHEIRTPEFVLTIHGRADGVLDTTDRLLIEEIKTVLGGWRKSADPLHWAQAKIYAYIFAAKNNRAIAEIQLTYLELESGEITEFRETFCFEELRQFFEEVTEVYVEWASRQHQWLAQRDQSIAKLAFPHTEYRHGQRELAVAAYRAMANGTKLFAEAPTGIGKTVAVLFPAIKALGEGHVEKVFFLTAKTTARAIAEEATKLMRASGLRLRTLTLTAKDKICFNNGQPCEVQFCPFAIGYYDRIKGAISDALREESLTQTEIEAIARRHNVCPFELSLDVSLWVDLIICDYNYVFDPTVSLKRFFSDEGGDYVFLVDEAHNLVDRAREMFSAELDFAEICAVEKAIVGTTNEAAKPLRKLQKLFRQHCESKDDQTEPIVVQRELPADLLPPIRAFCKAAEQWLALNVQTELRAGLLQFYFRCLGFSRTAELYDERYATLFDTTRERLRLFCLDPARGIQSGLERGKAAIFFSATLRPMDYYREILGGELGDATLQLQSPFAEENLCVLLHDRVRADLRGRDSSYGEVARSIGALVQSRPGNYLVFFPSYKYLEAVREQFQVEQPFIPVLSQRPSMPESERKTFVAAFQSDETRPLVGFAVMGGIFGEGIDLVGNRLVGAVIVGVGLPQLCVERNLIRGYFEEKNGLGFEYAYVFPGMNRVIQAAGRVIRSENDRGVVLLMDNRFAQARYRELLPRFWSVGYVRNAEEITQRAQEFWNCH